MSKRYRIGIDVGLRSVGLCAVEIDDSSDNPLSAIPMKLLSAMSVIHDGGIDPDSAKTNTSRMSCSGVARRARKLRKRSTQRKSEIEKVLTEHGFDVDRAKRMGEVVASGDPYFSWHARNQAATEYIADDKQRNLAIAVSISSIANHRGWRNPYTSASALESQCDQPSTFFLEFVDRLVEEGRIGEDADVNSDTRPTIAQLVVKAGLLDPGVNFRGNPSKRISGKPVDQGGTAVQSIPLGKLHQSDYYYEAKRILETQRVSTEVENELLSIVFKQISPRDTGSAASRVAHDDLQPDKIRASKASPAFQRFRILATLQCIRVKTADEPRRLTADELKRAYDFLCSNEAASDPDLGWSDVAESISSLLVRSDLVGVGGATEEGEPISAKKPPILTTQSTIVAAGKKNACLKAVVEWWLSASDDEQEMFVEFLNNAGIQRSKLDDDNLAALNSVEEMASQLSEDALAALEKISLPAGRAKYSVDTLRRLSKRMLNEGMDLFEARTAEFNVPRDWRPSPEELGTRTGNPAVDRTLRIVSRWVKACVNKWGLPETVNIEHVREGFVSPKKARELDANRAAHYKKNDATRREIIKALSAGEGTATISQDSLRLSDIRRWQAIQRQNCQCAYCGQKIDFYTAQMDHIVPRKGVGSTNTMDNLVATCAKCNLEKGNTLFSKWATPAQQKAAIERVKHWNRDSYFSSNKEFAQFKRAVIARLRQKAEDDPIDNRSIESVAWMATMLREQIEGYLARCTNESGENTHKCLVRVYRGWITSEARRASGIEKQLPWIGGASGKTRLDRRHHAIDAAVIAMLRPAVAQVLAERESMHRAANDLGEETKWKSYVGANPEHKWIYLNWRDKQMASLCILLQRAMDSDHIVVTTPLRLRLSRGRVHDDTICKTTALRVGDKMSATAIDKVASPAVWGALVSQPDYDSKNGLPTNPERRLRVHGKVLDSSTKIQFMAKNIDEIDKEKYEIPCPVRGGYAGAGGAIHHARIYRIPKVRGKGYQFALLRVVAVDLAHFRDDDLFSVELPRQSLSVRFAYRNLKQALENGSAEYIGWLVANDELVIDPSVKLLSPDGEKAINHFMRAFPDTRRFKVMGFPQKTKIQLGPKELSSEGMVNPSTASGLVGCRQFLERLTDSSDWSDLEVKDVYRVIDKGVTLSVDKVFSADPLVVRRSTLGYPRWKSTSNMPISWSV